MQRIDILTLSVAAAGTIAAETFGTLTGATATAAGNAAGVFRSKGEEGDLVPLDVLGTTIVVAAETIAPDEAIEVGANGQAAVLAAGTQVARAVTGGDAGDRIEVLLIPN